VGVKVGVAHGLRPLEWGGNRFVGVRLGVKFFFGQSIGIDENITFQLKCYSIIKTVGATDFI